MKIVQVIRSVQIVGRKTQSFIKVMSNLPKQSQRNCKNIIIAIILTTIFLTLNCQSFSTAKRDLETLCENYRLDLLCLTETWETEKARPFLSNWISLSKPRGGDGHGGGGWHVYINSPIISLCRERRNLR